MRSGKILGGLGMTSKLWTEFLIGDLCEISSSKRIFSKEYVSFGVPFYRSKEIIKLHNQEELTDTLYISEDRYREIEKKFGSPKKGDMLLTSVGTLGVPYLVNKRDRFYFKDGNLTWFKKFKTELDSKYLFYWIKSPIGKEKLKEITIGSTQQALTIDALKKIKIMLPSLVEQNGIVDILSKIDEKISTNNQINKTLEEMAAAIFKHWFVDFEFPNENGEPYRSSGGEMVESELGMIPKFFELKTLEEIALINPTEKLSKGKESIYVEMANLPTHSARIKGYEKKEYKGGTKFRNGDILFARITPCLENGKTAIVDFLKDDEVGFGSTEYIILRPLLLNSYYLYLLSRNDEFRNNAIKNMNGTSGRQRVDSSAIKQYRVACPTDDILERFLKICKPMFEQIKYNDEVSNALSNTRDTLLPKLMSGEIRVPIEE